MTRRDHLLAVLAGRLSDGAPEHGCLELSVRGDTGSPIELRAGPMGTEVVPADSVVNVWCAVKPAASMVLLCVMAEHGLPLDARLVELLPELSRWEAADGLTVVELLGGALALTSVNLMLARLTELDDLAELVIAEQPRRITGSRPADFEFSEFSMWWVVAALIETITGRPHLDVLAERLSAGGLDVYVGDHDANPIPYGRLAPYLEPGAECVLPLLHDAVPSENRRWHLGYGGFASAAGLAEFYARVIRSGAAASTASGLLPGRAVLGLLGEPSGLGAGGVFQRLGLLSLDPHLIGAAGERTRVWGQLGWESRCIAGVDLEARYGFALVCTDLSYPPERMKSLASNVVEAVAGVLA
ncbi:MAG: serine hydrolase [Acidimicrobiia bacterium]